MQCCTDQMYSLSSTECSSTCLLQLCQVYDSAEFCRNVHASTEWRQQALQAVMITASGLHQYCSAAAPLLIVSILHCIGQQYLYRCFDSIYMCDTSNAAVLKGHNSVSYMAFQITMKLFPSLTWVCRIHTGAEHASGALQCCSEVNAAL